MASPQPGGGDGPAGIVRAQPGDVGQELKMKERDQRFRHAGGQAADAKEQFEAERELVAWLGGGRRTFDVPGFLCW